MTWDSAFDQQQVTFCVNPHNFKVLRSATNVTHMAGHLLAFEDAAGSLVLTNRTWNAM
jgi:hypothetical protein